jgi:hypothetical protein
LTFEYVFVNGMNKFYLFSTYENKERNQEH